MVVSQVAEAELSLIDQAQDGDRNAYGELVRRYYSDVVHVVYRMCSDEGLAEDMAQETFLRAWVNLSSFQPQTSLRNWLFRIAVNAALDVLRRKTEDPIGEERMQMVTDQAPGPEATMIVKEQAIFIQRAMQSLPEASRSVLVLREYSELSYQEIASVLDIPVGTVMSRLNYARTKLRELLKAQLLQMENDYA